MRLTRRKFLVLGLAAGAALVYAARKWRWTSPEDVVIAILRRRVGYLKVAESSFHDFAQRYLEHHDPERRLLRGLSIVAPALRLARPYRWSGRVRWLEDSVVSAYLLSTDFFQNGADEQRAVAYLRFTIPTAACAAIRSHASLDARR